MAAQNLQNHTTEVERALAIQDLLVFLRDFSTLVDAHLNDVRKIMITTVDEMMNSVNMINEATDFKKKKADELIVKGSDGGSFVSRSAKEVDVRYADPAERVKEFNAKLSGHMATLANLDDSVRGVLFTIMGSLSMDDVVRQRLEHVSTSIHAMKVSVENVINYFTSGGLNEAHVDAEMSVLVNKMYKSFTMEDEKTVFRRVLGDVKNYR